VEDEVRVDLVEYDGVESGLCVILVVVVGGRVELKRVVVVEFDVSCLRFPIADWLDRHVTRFYAQNRADKCNVNVEFTVTLHEQVRYRGTLQY